MTWTNRKCEGQLAITTEKEKSYSFEEIEHCMYLDTELYAKPDIRKDVQQRIIAGSRGYTFT